MIVKREVILRHLVTKISDVSLVQMDANAPILRARRPVFPKLNDGTVNPNTIVWHRTMIFNLLKELWHIFVVFDCFIGAQYEYHLILGGDNLLTSSRGTCYYPYCRFRQRRRCQYLMVTNINQSVYTPDIGKSQ